MSDPAIVKALQDPKMMKAMVELQTGGPAAMKKYESDPEFMQLLQKIQAAMAGASSAGAPTPGSAGADGASDGMGFTKSSTAPPPGTRVRARGEGEGRGGE